MDKAALTTSVTTKIRIGYKADLRDTDHVANAAADAEHANVLSIDIG